VTTSREEKEKEREREGKESNGSSLDLKDPLSRCPFLITPIPDARERKKGGRKEGDKKKEKYEEKKKERGRAKTLVSRA